MTLGSVVAASFALMTGADALARPIHPQIDLLIPWTTALRDQQAERPWALVYDQAGKRLIFVAVRHENALDSPTSRLIDDAFRLWPIRSAILEGTSSSLGANPPQLVAIVKRPFGKPGFDPDGETGAAVRNAVRAGARLYGGEADDLVVRAVVRRAGVSELDLLGYYTLRVIPQWTRDGSISGPDDTRLEQLVDEELRRSRQALALPSAIMPDYQAFAQWYERLNGKALTGGMDQDEVGPLVDGRWPTNRIAAAVARARDQHLLTQIAERLNADGSVAVVFGASHAVIARRALDAMLGKPCYVGTNMKAAADHCRATISQDLDRTR